MRGGPSRSAAGSRATADALAGLLVGGYIGVLSGIGVWIARGALLGIGVVGLWRWRCFLAAEEGRAVGVVAIVTAAALLAEAKLLHGVVELSAIYRLKRCCGRRRRLENEEGERKRRVSDDCQRRSGRCIIRGVVSGSLRDGQTARRAGEGHFDWRGGAVVRYLQAVLASARLPLVPVSTPWNATS